MKQSFTETYYSFGSDIVFNSLPKGVAAKLLAFADREWEYAERYSRNPHDEYRGDSIIVNGIEYQLEFISINYNWKCTSVYFHDVTRHRLIRISDHWCHKVGVKAIDRGHGRKGVADMATATKMVNSHWELKGSPESFEVFNLFGQWEAGELPNGVYRPATNGKIFEGGWASWQDVQLASSLKGLKPRLRIYHTPDGDKRMYHTSASPSRGKHPSKINSEYKKTHKGK